MSILANLLKKAETSQVKGDIPPDLLQTVRSSAAGTVNLKRYLLLGILAVASIAVGGLLALYLDKRPVSHSPAVQQALPKPSAAIQKPLSTAGVPASTPAAVTVNKPVAPSVPAGSEAVRTPVKPKPHQLTAGGRAKHTRAAPPSAPPAAQQTLKPVVKDRATIDALLFAARTAEARHDFAVALKQYQKALDADPFNYRIMNNVASTMLQLGFTEQALAVANRALSIKPDYPSAMVNAGIALGKMGNDAASRGMFHKALALEPTNRNALFSLAVSLERGGLWDDALVSYQRLAEAGDVRGVLGQGRMQERRGNASEALRLYREVLVPADVGQRTKELARERIRALEQ